MLLLHCMHGLLLIFFYCFFCFMFFLLRRTTKFTNNNRGVWQHTILRSAQFVREPIEFDMRTVVYVCVRCLLSSRLYEHTDHIQSTQQIAFFWLYIVQYPVRIRTINWWHTPNFHKNDFYANANWLCSVFNLLLLSAMVFICLPLCWRYHFVFVWNILLC